MLLSCAHIKELNIKYLIFAGVLASIYGLSFFECSNAFSRYFLEDSLYDSNLEYLEQSEWQATEDFIALSAVGALLNTVQTSTFGIDFLVKAEVNAGKEMETLTKLTQSGAKYSALSVSAAAFMTSVISLAKTITPFLFKVVLVLGIVYCLLSYFRFANSCKNMFSVVRLSLTLFLTCHLVIPYTVHICSLTNAAISHKQASQYFVHMHDHYTSSMTGSDSKKRTKSLIGLTESILVKIERKVETLLRHTVRYMINVVLTQILLPLGCAYILICILRLLLLHSFRHPLERVLGAAPRADS